MSDENNQTKASTHSLYNRMPVPSVSSASVHYLVSDVAAAAIASSIVKDLIAAGHHSQSISYLSVDPNKTRRGKENR